MKQWYEALFENYAQQYDREPFTQGTQGECDFLEAEFNHDRSLRVLDIGCGTGRHAIELAKRGYTMTGVDLSEGQLKRARENAASASVAIDFQKRDARDLPFTGEFDVAIMLCEGGFSLMETDEMNFAILRSATRALKEEGKFVFTALNGLFPLFQSVEKFHTSQQADGGSTFLKSSFDLMTFRDHSAVAYTDDAGKKMTLNCNERYYMPSEITWLLKSLGYRTIDVFGAKLGKFSRADELTPTDFEMLVIAEK
ncbi:MAG: methyltransferase domain-containing protein [Candidatus Hydrogenedentes bacterium]|nr:methyltransferase domain-containing protein [Candidatus Hydrogenedentota bacterium]